MARAAALIVVAACARWIGVSPGDCSILWMLAAQSTADLATKARSRMLALATSSGVILPKQKSARPNIRWMCALQTGAVGKRTDSIPLRFKYALTAWKLTPSASPT